MCFAYLGFYVSDIFKKTASTLKKAMRIISGIQPRESITKQYLNSKILKIEELYNFETAKIMHKAFTNCLPSPLNIYFKKVDNVHHCPTRSSFHKNYFLPRFKKKTQRSIKFQGVSI